MDNWCVFCGQPIEDGRFVCPKGVSCKVTAPNPKTYTLEEIANKICASYEECAEGVCPGFDYCRHTSKGVLKWLKDIIDKED